MAYIVGRAKSVRSFSVEVFGHDARCTQKRLLFRDALSEIIPLKILIATVVIFEKLIVNSDLTPRIPSDLLQVSHVHLFYFLDFDSKY